MPVAGDTMPAGRCPATGGRSMIHVKKILYPTDFSSYSNQAYFHALALAETYGASLTVVYVHAPGTTGDKAYWRGQLEQVRPVNPKIPVSHVLLEGRSEEHTSELQSLR